MSAASRGLVRAVRYYQRTLSPRKPVPTCRFTPTCSEYAAQAITRHGALKGGWLAAWRVMRCHPLSPVGYDPVPEAFPFRLAGHAPPAPPTPDVTNEPSPRSSKETITP